MTFNAHGPDGLTNCKAPGQPSKLTDTHQVALAVIESGPTPAVDGLVRWRLVAHRKLSACPRHHAQAEGAVEAFKKRPARLDEIARQTGVEPDRIECVSARGTDADGRVKCLIFLMSRGHRGAPVHIRPVHGGSARAGSER